MKEFQELTPPKQALSDDGYFIARSLLNQEELEHIRQAIVEETERLALEAQFNDALLEATAKEDPQSIPLDKRFRKLSQLHKVKGVWEHWLANPKVLSQLEMFLGQNILNKFASAFLKPAQVGGPTPWHQDIGLWRDQNVSAINAWLAVDAATKENGCLQVVKGSHKGPIVAHVLYEDSIHAELPRDRCNNLTVEHIELAPGDVLFWHSNLWHYSPPNTSDHARLGCGAVWINPDQLPECRPQQAFHWCMKDAVAQNFPPEPLNANQDTNSASY